MVSLSIALFQTCLRRGGIGFSLVECLIANVLILVMISALISASLDVVVATRLGAERSDQSLRLWQLRHSLDATVATARMPPEWLNQASTRTTLSPWQRPAAPCESPVTAMAREQWGGVDLIDLNKAPCVPGVSTGPGLYVERVLPCPMQCKQGPGYRVAPARCHVEQPNEADSGGLWRVDWQENLSSPENCPEGTAWGRLERLIISYRTAAHLGNTAPELRMQSLTEGPEYGWSSAETLVAGISDWQVTRINGFPAPSTGSSEAEAALGAITEGVPLGAYFQLGFSVISLDSPFSVPPLRVSQLLLPHA